MGAEPEIKGGWPEGARGAAASGTARTNRHTLCHTEPKPPPAQHTHTQVPFISLFSYFIFERARARVAITTAPKGHHLLVPTLFFAGSLSLSPVCVCVWLKDGCAMNPRDGITGPVERCRPNGLNVCPLPLRYS